MKLKKFQRKVEIMSALSHLLECLSKPLKSSNKTMHVLELQAEETHFNEIIQI